MKAKSESFVLCLPENFVNGETRMKFGNCLKLIATVLLFLGSVVAARAQAETLTNAEIVRLSQAGLGKQIIVEKIKDSIGNYDLSADGLIALKKAAVEEEVIAAMFDVSRKVSKQNVSNSTEPNPNPAPKKDPDKTAAQLLREAKTVSFTKNSLYPALKDVEGSLMTGVRRAKWERFGLTIMQNGFDSDLVVEIGHEFLSHYNFRVVDAKSGRTIAASGVTSLGGALAGNVADKLIKRLNEVLANESR